MNLIKNFLIVLMVVFLIASPNFLLLKAQDLGNDIQSDLGNDPESDLGNDASSGGSSTQVGHIKNPIKVDNIQDFIKTVLEGVLRIAIPIVVLAIIYSGFLFVKARGNEKELETAKNALLYTLIGAAVLLGSWAIAQIIADTVLSL
jgi:hypothetical protein